LLKISTTCFTYIQNNTLVSSNILVYSCQIIHTLRLSTVIIFLISQILIWLSCCLLVLHSVHPNNIYRVLSHRNCIYANLTVSTCRNCNLKKKRVNHLFYLIIETKTYKQYHENEMKRFWAHRMHMIMIKCVFEIVITCTIPVWENKFKKNYKLLLFNS
jgi:hypothetical protein